MLELTGRVADGWLPSLAYLADGDLARGNARIDEAARRQAGRRLRSAGCSTCPAASPRVGAGTAAGPGRAVGGRPARAGAVDDGIGTFILGTDDPDDLRRFAGEVAPAVRELVGPNAPSPRPRPARWLRWSKDPQRLLRMRPSGAPLHRGPDPRRRGPPQQPRRVWDDAHGPPGRRPIPTAPTPFRARRRTAPDRRPRPPARRARPGAGPRRAGRGRLDGRRGGAVAPQHDDDAAEQLDARHLLRVLLPGGDHPPHPRGPVDAAAPEAGRPTAGAGGGPVGGTSTW